MQIKPRRAPADIHDLAMKHLTRHKNDKSLAVLARMNRRFGHKRTDAAIREAAQTLRMMGVKVIHEVQTLRGTEPLPASQIRAE